MSENQGVIKACGKIRPFVQLEPDYWVMDADAVIRDREGNIMMLEIKRNNYKPKPHQVRTMKIIDQVFKFFMENSDGTVTIEIDGRKEVHPVNWAGYNLLQLSGTSFFDSDFRWNGELVTTEELIRKLSFESESAPASEDRHMRREPGWLIDHVDLNCLSRMPTGNDDQEPDWDREDF